jgi:hypothetical protein
VVVVTGVSSYWVTVHWGRTLTAWYEICKVCVSMTSSEYPLRAFFTLGD